jgi:uncharacterized protein (DUF1697 family)
MKTYIALLRGINVSGHKLIKMSELKTVFESCGFSNVTTYIQSGNVVFSSTISNKESIKNNIETALKNKFGFDVYTIVLSKEELFEAGKNHSYLAENVDNLKSIYYSFFDESLNQELVKDLHGLTQETEFFAIEKNVIYCFYPNGYGNSKWNNVFFEKKLKINCTTRNYNTVNKLIELSNQFD